jgi:rhodanese-related sulfurtransferase
MMKYMLAFIALILNTVIVSSSCTSSIGAGENFQLNAREFSEKIANTPSAIILDVRTEGEFSKGHITNAININWNAPTFDGKINNIPKNAPVFIYCLSGSRSMSAANFMRRNGYEKVYELTGGIMKWSAAGLPLSTEYGISKTKEMSLTDFKKLTKGDKIILVDFYADWCLPCKKMEPFLNEIAKEHRETLTLLRINADEQSTLCKILKVDALPYLQIYQNELLQWEKVGFINKKGIEKEINRLNN